MPIMFRKIFFLLLLSGSILFLSACQAGEQGTPPPETLTLEACHMPNGWTAQCGHLTVPENREDPGGRTIDLNIVVVPAASSLPQPEPVFLLAGGPGQAAVDTFSLALNLFAEVHVNHDIVFFDQRGTGGSNPLACDQLVELSLDAEEEEVKAALNACRLDLEARADLTQYVTEIAMADLDEVRQALGYQQVHLYGVSYGTRAALTYLRLYPAHVRSIVLDSVVSPELVLQLQVPRDAQRSLDLLFERCAQDADCSSQFPEFESQFYALRDQAGQGVPVSFSHPTTGESLEFTLDEEGFMQVIFNLLYSTEITPLLPMMVQQVYSSGDFGPLMAQYFMLSGEMYVGMHYAVTCSEDAAVLSLEQVEEYHQGSNFPSQAADFVENCREWPLAEVSPRFRTIPAVDVPVLLLSGDADPVTPPYYAEQVSSALPNSLHLVFPHFGHGLLTNVCALQIMADFYDQPDLAALDTACAAEAAPMPFFMSLTGPRP